MKTDLLRLKGNNLSQIEKAYIRELLGVTPAIEEIKQVAGTSYIYVTGKSTPTANFTELQLAYTAATNLSPNGSAKSDTNRVTIVVGPGTYQGTINFNTPYVNVVSLTGQCDVRINGITISVDYGHYVGLESYGSSINDDSKRFILGNNLSHIVLEKCKCDILTSFGVNHSTYMGSTIVSGTFIDCEASSSGFATNEIASGTFIRCTGGGYSFGSNGTASGIFVDCTSTGSSAFAGSNGQSQSPIASGTFTRCKGIGGKAFGVASASGVFIECIGGPCSFTSNAVSSNPNCTGTFYRCQAGQYSYGGAYGGLTGTFSGKAFSCIGGEGSFGSTVITGKLRNCIMEAQGSPITNTNVTFPNCTGAGKIVNCIDATDAVITK